MTGRLMLLAALTLADFGSYALLRAIAGPQGELNPFVTALWAAGGPIALIAWKLAGVGILAACSLAVRTAFERRAIDRLVGIGVIALAIGVGINLGSLLVLIQIGRAA